MAANNTEGTIRGSKPPRRLVEQNCFCQPFETEQGQGKLDILGRECQSWGAAATEKGLFCILANQAPIKEGMSTKASDKQASRKDQIHRPRYTEMEMSVQS